MQTKEKINVSGKMKSLAVGEWFTLEKPKYRSSCVRSCAGIIKQDFGMIYSVSVSDSEIKVERVK